MFQKYMAGQYRRPGALVGRWIGQKMATQHRPENLWTVDLLHVQPDDHILEVGFGAGIAVQAIAARLSDQGLIAGVDFSKTMVKAAQKRNKGVGKGRVDLRYGEAAKLPFMDSNFDKAFSIHSIYFWTQPLAALEEIWRVLKPGGLVILTVLPREKWNISPDDEMQGCIPYSGEELKNLLAKANFRERWVKADPNPQFASNFSVMGRK